MIMIKSLISTALLSFSIGSKSIEHREASTNRTNIFGSYNFRNVMGDFSPFNDSSVQIVFDEYDSEEQYKQLVPIHRSAEQYNIYYLRSIDFVVGYDDDLEVIFNVYNMANSSVNWSYSLDSFDDISDFTSSTFDIIFEVRNSYVITGLASQMFESVFTLEDNVYTTSYNGYYSFNNGLSSIPSSFIVFGYTVFNQSTYTAMFNYGDGVHGNSSTVIYLSYYAQSTNYVGFNIESVTLPFNKNVIISNNVLMTNVKMSQQSYLRLANVGVFAYQRDSSHDNDDWQDLLFSVMDSPIYMISRLLNFEIFGINLFIALTGLLTVVVIVFLVKKFL